MDITDRIGISTHFIPAVNDEDIFTAISLVRSAGFTTFELVPSKDQAQIGWPETYYNIGVEPKELTPDERQRLKEAVSNFNIFTLHAPHLALNISSTNRHIRKTSWEVYEEVFNLAIDIGVNIVTFHPGSATSGIIRSPALTIERCIAFGKEINKRAKEFGISVGFEVCSSFSEMCQMVDGIGEGFGLNLDIGHALMAESSDDWLDKYCLHFKGRIVEVHMNGVNHYWGKFMEHQPVHLNNAIDYQATFERLKADDYKGPIICEIQGNDIEQVIKHCQEAKEMIVGIWNGTRKLNKRWNVVETG